jgi:hypothetical protein
MMHQKVLRKLHVATVFLFIATLARIILDCAAY